MNTEQSKDTSTVQHGALKKLILLQLRQMRNSTVLLFDSHPMAPANHGRFSEFTSQPRLSLSESKWQVYSGVLRYGQCDLVEL